MTPARQQLIVESYARGDRVDDILSDWCISGATLTRIIRQVHAPLRTPDHRSRKRVAYLKRPQRVAERNQPCSGAPNTFQPSSNSSKNNSSVLPIGP